MPEFREDPFTGRWILLAPERARRPLQTGNPSHSPNPADDPFGEGHEAATTPEVFAIRAAGTAPNQPGWRVRVVTNKFPALVSDDTALPHDDGLYRSRPGTGLHDVIIECPQFETRMARLSLADINCVLRVYRERLLACRRNPELAAAIIFKNEGALAGASIPHCHSQLMATEFVPPALASQLERANAYFLKSGRSLFTTVMNRERQEQLRVVMESSRFVAFCPYASRFAYETWILGRSSGSHFSSVDDDTLEDLAQVLWSVLNRLQRVLDDPAMNFVLQTAPLQEPERPSFQWRLEILPRRNQLGGYEWGSDCYINTVTPEAAAAELRSVE